MKILANGKTMYDDIYELYYNLFNEIGLSINSDNYLYDQDTMEILKYKEKFIKAFVDSTSVYAGKYDVIFNPAKYYKIMVAIFGYYIDKESKNLNGDTIGYITQFLEENETRDKQRLVVRTSIRGDIISDYYYNLFLGYIDCIFKLAGEDVDLSNFDIVEEPPISPISFRRGR